ncbi:MAG TPA: cobalamin-binding protein [Candidatus Limnocylindrales bacterium]
MRIVSLVPSATEIVCALGLSRQLVGVTHACDFPAEARGKAVVTRPIGDLRGVSDAAIHRRMAAAIGSGTPVFEVDEDAIRRAKPDLIITQALCAVCAPSGSSVAELARSIDPAITVVTLEPSSLEGIFNTISTIGAMTETEHKALALLSRLRGRLGRIEQKVAKSRAAGHQPLRVVGLEWLDPPMVVGHWIPEQIRRAGGWDLLGRDGEKSVRTTWSSIRAVEPDMLLLLPCGFGLEETKQAFARMPRPAFWSELMAVQRQNVIALDGSAFFDRPGPRVVDGISLLAEIFDPDRFVDVSPPMSWEPIPV